MIIRVIIFEDEFAEEQDKPLSDDRIEHERIPQALVEIRELLEEGWLGLTEEDFDA